MKENLKKKIIFIVVGRLGKRLTKSKAEPFAYSENVSKIFIFREEQGIPIDKCTYIVHSKWITRIKPHSLRKTIRFFYEPLQIIRYTLKYRPFLINGVFTLPKGLYSLIAARLCRTKCVVSIIGGIPEITTYSKLFGVNEQLNMMIYKFADIVTTKGQKISTFLTLRGLNPQKIIILNGSIEVVNAFGLKPHLRDIDILFVGNFSRLKGPDRVVEVIKCLKEKYNLYSVKSVFLGDGKLFENIKSLVSNYYLTNNIILNGYTENVLTYFSRSKILIMPSSSEGLSTAMLEGMAYGCVPVVSDVGNMREAAIHDNTAYLVEDYQDIGSFSKFAFDLITDECKRGKMAQNGIKLVNEKYSISAQAKVVDHILAKLQSND